MSILNRRNAVVGWATWWLGKRVLKRKARAAAAPAVETLKKRGSRGAIAFLAAAAVGLATWLSARTRRRKGEGQ
jgi:hypothetical protein